MKIPEFIKVENTRNLTFMDVWKIYDNQFEVLREFMMTLGDKYVVEEFTGSSSKIIYLNESYSSGQLFLYINGVIQWKDKDYVETSSRSITLMYPRKTSDIIMVVIVRSNIIRENIESYIEEIKKACDGSKDSLERAQKLIASIEFLELELEQKREEFEKQRYLLSDFLSDFDSKYNNFVDNVEQQESILEEVRGHAESVKTMNDSVSSNTDLVKSLSESVNEKSELINTLHGDVESNALEVSENTELVKSLSSSVSDAKLEVSVGLENARVIYDNISTKRDEVINNADNVKLIAESMSSTKEEVEENLAISEAYLDEIREIKNEISNLGNLTPEEIQDNEVILARRGAISLGTRLNDMMYKFSSIFDMQKCRHLHKDDVCLILDDDGTSFMLFKIMDSSDGENVSDYSTVFYNILDTDMYAYLVYDIGKRISDLEEGITGGSGSITDIDLTEVYTRFEDVDKRINELSNSNSNLSERVTALENKDGISISVDGENVIITSESNE